MAYEVEVYRGTFDAKIEDIRKVLDQFLIESLNFGTRYPIEIERVGIKQIWYCNIPDKKGMVQRRNYGYIELNPLLITNETPVEVRIVCCFEPLVMFWENLAHSFRVTYLIGDMKPDSPFPEAHLTLTSVLKTHSSLVKETEHFAHPKKTREEIVREYRRLKAKREISNKDAWAKTHYGITGKTLRNYEREFPAET